MRIGFPRDSSVEIWFGSIQNHNKYTFFIGTLFLNSEV